MYRFFFQNETTDKKKYWFYLILLVLCDSLAVLTPILLGYLVDFGLKSGSMNFLFGFGILIFFFVLIRTCGSYFTVIQLDCAGTRIVNNRKRQLYQKIHKNDQSFFHQNHVGELMNLMNSDLENIRTWFCYCIKQLSYNWIHFFVSFFFFAFISLPMTFFFLIYTVLQTIVMYFFFKRNFHYYDKLRDENAKLTKQIQDYIDGSRVLKSFQAMDSFSSFLQTENERIKKIDLELSYKRNRFFNRMYFFSYFLSILFLVFVTYLFFQGSISIGEIIILDSLLGYFQEPFNIMNDMLDYYQKAKISLKRLTKVFNYQTKIKNQEKMKLDTLLKPIEFQHVFLKLEKKDVLKDITFTINPRKTIAFIGLTGSGKSSIANLMERYLNPTKGKILLDDFEIDKYDLISYRKKIGYVFQEPFLFSDTILNNIFFGSTYSKKILNELIEICNLQFVLELPNQFETVIGEKGVGLSGGEKQRIALARALAMNPEILILDDMTSALDMETENSIISSIYKMKDKTTKIIIAEKIVSVQNADMIYVMDDGAIMECGTHQELLQKEGYYYQMYCIQRSGFHGTKI